jgi:hypothetical protein
MDLCNASSAARSAAVLRQQAARRPRPCSRAASSSARLASNDPCTRSLQAHGARGELRFRLQSHQGGLYVEREEIPRRGPHCVQSMHFRDASQFERWCDGDPARFAHPLLHLALKRDGQALWQLIEPTDA